MKTACGLKLDLLFRDGVAKESGISNETIRYYERIGLLVPFMYVGDRNIRLFLRSDARKLRDLIAARKASKKSKSVVA
jgi:DNA-binding transcriptional MerR regulator